MQEEGGGREEPKVLANSSQACEVQRVCIVFIVLPARDIAAGRMAVDVRVCVPWTNAVRIR